MDNKVPAVVAAKELNIGLLTLYGLMQEGKLNIGYAIKLQGKQKWSYHIYRNLLDQEKERLGINHE